MDYDRLIIDGYNLLHQDGAPGSGRGDLQAARQRLVRRIEQAALSIAPRITVVFDGREGGRDDALEAPHLEVIFSPSDRTADGVIEQLVHAADRPERILVVTSDWTEQRLVSAFGASVISCRDFLLRCAAAEAPPPGGPPGKRFSGGSRLGDFFPE